MGQHLNRLDKKDASKWDMAYAQFCKTREWNLWDGQMKTTKVYLVEVVIRKKLHPIAIKTNWEIAHNLLAGRAGLITEMIIDKEYPERPWKQWAYGEEHNKNET